MATKNPPTSSQADAPRSTTPTTTDVSDPKALSHLQVPHLQQGVELPSQGAPIPDHMTQIEDARKREAAEHANEIAARQSGRALEVGAELEHHDADGKVRRVRVESLGDGGVANLVGDDGWRQNGAVQRVGGGAGWAWPLETRPASALTKR